MASAEAMAKAAHAKKVAVIDVSTMSPHEVWAVQKAPRDAINAAKAAALARAEAESLLAEARAAEIRALEHSENANVRVMSKTEGIKTLQSLSAHVKTQLADAQQQGELIGDALRWPLAAALSPPLRRINAFLEPQSSKRSPRNASSLHASPRGALGGSQLLRRRPAL